MTSATIEGIKKDITSIKNQLSQTKGELQVKVALASMEIRDEWESLQKEWDHFVAKAKPIIDDLEESSEDAIETIKSMGEKIKKRFKVLADKLD